MLNKIDFNKHLKKKLKKREKVLLYKIDKDLKRLSDIYKMLDKLEQEKN